MVEGSFSLETDWFVLSGGSLMAVDYNEMRSSQLFVYIYHTLLGTVTSFDSLPVSSALIGLEDWAISLPALFSDVLSEGSSLVDTGVTLGSTR